MAVNYASLLAQLEALESNPTLLSQVPDETRERWCQTTRLLSVKLERGAEALPRLMICQPVEEASVRIAADLNLFSVLAANDSIPKTLDELTEATRADPFLLKRLLRCLAANGAIQETPGGYASSPSFELLAGNSMAQAYGPCDDFLRKNYDTLPHFLKQTKYQTPSSATDTVVQRAYGMPQKLGMEIIGSNMQAMQAFSVLMSTWGEGFIQFHSLYPLKTRVIASFDETKSDTMFVDVGGGFGQKSIALKAAFPQLPGRVVVQDLERIMNIAPRPDPATGIELMAHDFFEEQPVKGAKVYYLRQCLHNWTDEKAAQILRRIHAAMTPGYSILIIHEIVMPERGAARWATSQDFEMLNMFAARERTQDEWIELCRTSGFGTTELFLGSNSGQEAVIEVRQ